MTTTAHLVLADGHSRDLAKSGLTTDTILAAGIYSASAGEVAALLGYGAGPGMVIPYEWGDDGRPIYARVKLNTPGSDGKAYRSPKGRGNRLYVPRTLDVHALGDPRAALYITEGEKKVLRAVQDGLLCIGVAGVWSWRQTLPDHTSAPVPELAAIPWTDRGVRLVFDSDAASKPNVREAEVALAKELTLRGARVSVIRLPAGPGGATQGLDDYLVAHGVETFKALPCTSVGEASPPPVIHIATFDEINALDSNELMTKFIVEPHVPEGGLTTLAAKPGVGKGKLAQDLCLARATGGTWLGLPVQPGPVLFWSAEQGKREDGRVTQALARGRGITKTAHYFGIVHDPPLRLGDPTMLEHVKEIAREHHPGLLLVIDSLRRAFAGEDRESEIADSFFRVVLVPLRALGVTVLILAHPPKTSGQQKRIEDENMVRGSGDFVAQLDSLLVLRPVDRKRIDAETETITMRLRQPKARGSAEATPLLVTLQVTKDHTAEVTFSLSAVPDDHVASNEAERSGALKAVIALAEEKKRLSRQFVIAANLGDYGRPARLAAIDALAAEGCLRGPLTKQERQKGERGHWYVFVKPLPPAPRPIDSDDEDADVC